MQRNSLTQLINWKNLGSRKPLLIDGARQTGKTYLVSQLFGPKHFPQTHIFDFKEDKRLHRYFVENINPFEIIKNLEIHQGRDIDLANDLIFFDEIGECPDAIGSLKYFCEKIPNAYLCASGSNIGLLDSFPVGKVQLVEIYPLTFEEFLIAAEDPKLLSAFQNQSRLEAVHTRLWSLLLDYYFVGGMPEAVNEWFISQNQGINERCQGVVQIHKNLVAGYYRDFGKYSGKANALHIEAVFNNIPLQLAKTVDDSVGRYTFKGVIPQKRRYRELLTPIEWLCKAKLANKNYVVNSEPKNPLKSLIKENLFKLFFFDVGLLGHLLEISYLQQRDQNLNIKGFIAENFVQCELIACGMKHTYSWQEKNAEIEFILKSASGDLIPIEVKSGTRTQAKSLQSYQHRYHPQRTVKLVGKVGGTDPTNMVWPLYYGKYVANL